MLLLRCIKRPPDVRRNLMVIVLTTCQLVGYGIVIVAALMIIAGVTRSVALTLGIVLLAIVWVSAMIFAIHAKVRFAPCRTTTTLSWQAPSSCVLARSYTKGPDGALLLYVS